MPESDNHAADDAEDREWAEDQRAWQANFEATKRNVLRAPIVAQRLDTLRKAGADADKVLALLCFVATDDSETITRTFESQQRKLTKLADKLEHISAEIGAVLSNPFNYSEFWINVLSQQMPPEYLNNDKLAGLRTAPGNRTKPLLKLLRAEARRFGALRKKYRPLHHDAYLGLLLKYVKESTGKPHDDEMADLLQAAHDALGVQAEFTAEGLRKLRQRKFPDLVQKREQSAPSDDWLGLMLGTPPSKLDKTPRKK
jgi:hypothetical protein